MESFRAESIDTLPKRSAQSLNVLVAQLDAVIDALTNIKWRSVFCNQKLIGVTDSERFIPFYAA